MNRQRRAFITAAILIASSGFVAGTNASYNALTRNTTGTITLDALYGPTGTATTLGGAPSGNNYAFTWTGFTRGGLQSNTGSTTGYTHRVLLADDTAIETDGTYDGANPPTCPAADPDNYPTIGATSSSATATTATTTSAVSDNTNQGAFRCALLVTNANNFYSQTNGLTRAVQIGHAMKSIVLSNGGTAGTLDDGDKITITFLQAVSSTSGQRPVSTNRTNTTASTSGNSICAHATSDIITLGRVASSGACLDPEPSTFVLGQITGLALNQTATFNAQYAFSGSVLTVTVRGKTNGTNPTSITGTPVFVPTTQSVLQSATGAVALCVSANTATSICRPTVTGSF